MSFRIRSIVAGVPELVDRSPELAAAVSLAARLGAALHLVHAFEISPAFLDRYESVGYADCDPLRLYAEGLQARLEGEARAATQLPGIRCHAVHAPPAQALAQVADEVGADLIVLGHTRRGPLTASLLGTTASHLFGAARVPVLALHRALAEPLRVVLACDLSDHAAQAHGRALPVVRALAGDGAPQVRSLFVTRHDEGDDEGWSRVERFVASLAPTGVEVEPRIRMGDPAAEIMAEAAEWDAALLVLGTHARTGAARFFLGSVAEEVLQAAPCSVLVVPPVAIRLPEGPLTLATSEGEEAAAV